MRSSGASVCLRAVVGVALGASCGECVFEADEWVCVDVAEHDANSNLMLFVFINLYIID
jgi:hypothetical protein